MYSTTLKQIAISKRNYELLKKLGGAGDSFNDVISQLLKNTTVIAIGKREREEKLISAHSSVGSPEERQAAQQPPLSNVKEEAIALMDNCIKTLLKSVDVNCGLHPLKSGKEVVPLQVSQEEAFKYERFRNFAARKEVTSWN